MILRNCRELICTFWSALHIFIQLPVSLFSLYINPSRSFAPLPVFLFLIPRALFSLRLPLSPVSLWQMSVVRGRVVVIRRALPRHSTLIPVSNLRENRLHSSQPWKQLLASGLSLQTPQPKYKYLTCLHSLITLITTFPSALPTPPSNFPSCLIIYITAELQRRWNAKCHSAYIVSILWLLMPTVSTEL